MLTTALVIGIGWGLYGLVSGMFIGTKTILAALGWIMALYYAYVCLIALFKLDWTLIVGVPCFLAGIGSGAQLFDKKSNDA